MLLFINACKENYSEIKISNLSKDTVFSLRSKEDNPTVLIFNVQGYIDDTCKISSIPIYKNNLNKDIFIDTYSKETKLKFESYKAKNGNLIIKYKF